MWTVGRATEHEHDIVEAIMDGWQPGELGVHVLREGFPVEWGEQQRLFGDSILV